MWWYLYFLNVGIYIDCLKCLAQLHWTTSHFIYTLTVRIYADEWLANLCSYGLGTKTIGGVVSVYSCLLTTWECTYFVDVIRSKYRYIWGLLWLDFYTTFYCCAYFFLYYQQHELKTLAKSSLVCLNPKIPNPNLPNPNWAYESN